MMKDQYQKGFSPFGALLSEAKYTGILFLILLIVFEGAIAYADWVNQGSNANYPIVYIVVLFAIILVLIFEAFPMSVIRLVLVLIDRIAGKVTLRNAAVMSVRSGIISGIVSYNQSNSPAYRSFKLSQNHSLLHMTFTDSECMQHNVWIDSSFLSALNEYKSEPLVFSQLVYGRLSKVVFSFQMDGKSFPEESPDYSSSC